MEWLERLLEKSWSGVWRGFVVGVVRGVWGCGLGRKIGGIGFMGKDIEKGRGIFWKGVVYRVGGIVW